MPSKGKPAGTTPSLREAAEGMACALDCAEENLASDKEDFDFRVAAEGARFALKQYKAALSAEASREEARLLEAKAQAFEEAAGDEYHGTTTGVVSKKKLRARATELRAALKKCEELG